MGLLGDEDADDDLGTSEADINFDAGKPFDAGEAFDFDGDSVALSAFLAFVDLKSEAEPAAESEPAVFLVGSLGMM